MALIGEDSSLEHPRNVPDELPGNPLEAILAYISAYMAPRKLYGFRRFIRNANQSTNFDENVFFKHVTIMTAFSNAGMIYFGSNPQTDSNNGVEVDSGVTFDLYNIWGRDIWYNGDTASDYFTLVGEV